MLEMEPPRSAETNQLRRLSDRAARVDLLESLGIVPSDFAQNDFVLIVEGERDAQWIRSLFPVETARALIYIAGSGNQVLQACEVFEGAADHLPWMAVMDRDLLTHNEVELVCANHSNLFVWRLREFENVLLDPGLVASTIARVGNLTPESSGRDRLAELAEPLKEDVIEQMSLSELRRRVPVEKIAAPNGRIEKARAKLIAVGAAHETRAALLEDVVAEVRAQVDQAWSTSWPALADGKALTSALRTSLGVFSSRQEFIAALLVTARETPEAQPREIQELGERLRATLGA